METKACDLSIIIVAHNVQDLMEKCLDCLFSSSDRLEKEIIFVDNGSTDHTVEMIKKKFPTVKIILSPTNLGFIKANNLGFQEASGKYILMLNSDAFVGDNTLNTLIDFMETTEDCGALGCQAIDGNGKALSSARYFPTPFRLFLTNLGLSGKIPFVKDINDKKQDITQTIECDWVTGCLLLTRKKIIDSLEFFLRPQLFMYNDDNDLCLRIKRKGWKIYCLPHVITHLAGVNNEKIAKKEKDSSLLLRLNLQSEYIYFRQNYGILKVLNHFILLTTFYIYSIIKNCILIRKNKLQKNIIGLQMTYQTLINTHFGSVDINRMRSLYQGTGIPEPQKTRCPHHSITQITRAIFHGAKLNRNFFEKRTLKAIFIAKDREWLKFFKSELQNELSNLKNNLPKNKEEELVWNAFLGHVLSLLPYAYPEEGDEISIPHLQNGECEDITFKIHVMDLTSNSWFSPLKALGLEPQNSKAVPLLIQPGTTYPTGDGFAASIFSDFTPGFSVGEVAYSQGKKVMGSWLENKTSVRLIGISLGGALAFHTIKEFYHKFDRVDVYNPPGLYRETWGNHHFDNGAKINIYCQSGDLVSKLGEWPTGEKVHLYKLTMNHPGIKEGIICSHVRAFSGCQNVHLSEKDPAAENRSLSRKILTILHRFVAPFLIFIPCCFIFGLYLFFKLIERVTSVALKYLKC